MYLSTALVLLGDVDFRLAFLMSSLAFDDLEEAIAADADVTRRIGMKRRFPRRQQNPVFAFYVSGQPSVRHRRQAQRAVGSSTIDVIRNRAAHRMTIAIQTTPAIASAV
jgi:hypothetical protein